MLIVLVALVVVVAVPLLGGSYTALAELRVRGSWLVALALGVQIVIISLLEIDAPWISRSLHVATYAMLGVCLLANRSIRWMWLVAGGWFSNFLVIVVNGGVMPTSLSAADQVGRGASTAFENSVPTASARLPMLGDVIATPADMPLANVFSVGDVLLVIGLAFVVLAASRTAQVGRSSSGTLY
jgi:hypothetical protein